MTYVDSDEIPSWIPFKVIQQQILPDDLHSAREIVVEEGPCRFSSLQRFERGKGYEEGKGE